MHGRSRHSVMEPTEPTELTMIVTAHNRADLVEDTLSSLAEQAWDGGSWDVVLVDNDSVDGTAEILERWADKMPVPAQVVRATEQHNLCHARQCGAWASSATSIAFLDDDDVIAPGYVAAMGEALRAYELVGPRHEHSLLNDEVTARYRGSFQTTELGEIFGVPMVSGGGFACRRSLWDQLGGHRIETGYGAEDADFCIRAARLGVRPFFVTEAIYHVRLRAGARASYAQGRAFALARVRLWRMFRDEVAAPSARTRRAIRSWAGLLLRLPTVREHGPRLVWAWQVGRAAGHLRGSWRERTWYP